MHNANQNPSTQLIATSRFQLSPQERADIEHAVEHYPDARAASIDALKIVQANHGWVPDGAIPAIAEVLGIPVPDVEGVATFYSQIFRVPVGRHVIRLCDSMTCYINGHESVLAALREQLGVGYGETTADGRFTLLPVCCLGNCDKGSTLMIDDDTYGGMSPDQVPVLLEKYA
ncbi:NADH-quinone oxidoreductase subunit NuoE [Perlucidibaca piscinae]|uniref:NADH-quinone oxidoreductase subunit NuoE n=1 Tax=Perlucidibaca piscinae TaxID=392589 RepID=UPI0003B50598|nr:NADH-quinone oxidoreductase subunit NuoE [Perlucidibaca piscinae]